MTSAGSTTATVAPTATASTPMPLYAIPPRMARAAPVKPDSRSEKPTRRPRSRQRRVVDQLRRGGDVRERPAETEPEQREAHGGDALDPRHEDRRDAHDRQPPDERRAPADPVDQVAYDEHEPVHADDVPADDPERVPRAVAVADDHVPGERHHRHHHREARHPRDESRYDTWPAEDRSQCRGVAVLRLVLRAISERLSDPLRIRADRRGRCRGRRP